MVKCLLKTDESLGDGVIALRSGVMRFRCGWGWGGAVLSPVGKLPHNLACGTVTVLHLVIKGSKS